MHFNLVNGIVLIEAMINNIKGHVAFDTGAMKTTLNRHYFPQLSGTKSSVITYDSGLSDTSIIEAKANILLNDGILIKDKEVNSINFDYVEQPLRKKKKDLKFLGTLGIDFIGNHNFIINYLEKTIEFKSIDQEELFLLSIPFQYDKLPIVNVSITKKIHRFVLDTGASCNVIDSNIIDYHQFEKDDDDKKIIIPKMQIGELELVQTKAISSDLTHLKTKIDVEGIIGYTLLKDHIYYFDFDACTLNMMQ